MSVAKFLELAAALPAEPLSYIGSVFQSEAYRPLYVPDEISYGLGQLPADQRRLKVKVVYENSWQDGKYGERVELFYLDDKPFVMISNYGKWLDNGTAYIVDKEVHEEARVWLFSLYDAPEEQRVEILTDEFISSLHEGKLVQGDFPFIKAEM